MNPPKWSYRQSPTTPKRLFVRSESGAPVRCQSGTPPGATHQSAPVRPYFGQNQPAIQFCRTRTMGAWKRPATARIYDASVGMAGKQRRFTTATRKDGPKSNKTPSRIKPLRPERGYLSARYDTTAAKTRKALRPEFGRLYDEKKVRNSCPSRSLGRSPGFGVFQRVYSL